MGNELKPQFDPVENDQSVVESQLLPQNTSDSDIVLERIIPYLANRLTFRMNQLLKKDLREHGLSIANWRILAVLDSNLNATVNELAAYAMIEQPTLSRLIIKMEEDGLLKRRQAEGDGRFRSISLTAEGRRKYQSVRALALAHTQRAITGLTQSERDDFVRTINKMRENPEIPLVQTLK